jgi:hypothetical protein
LAESSAVDASSIPSQAAPMEISPFMITWDPGTYPQFTIIADIGQNGATVRYFEGDTYMEYLVGSGILRRSQLDGKYDGSSQKFFDAEGAITQAGFAISEPYLYANDPTWNRAAGDGDPLRRQEAAGALPGEAGPDHPAGQVDFLQNPAKTNDFVVELVEQYKDPSWSYSPGLADYAIRQMRLDFVNNGPDRTLGNFGTARVQRLIDIVTPILVGQRQPPKEGLKPEDIATNEFIDPSIGVTP